MLYSPSPSLPKPPFQTNSYTIEEKIREGKESEDEQSNRDPKEDKLTSVPKEEDLNYQDEVKDEEEVPVPVEEPKELTPGQKFDELTDAEKQMVVDITLDLYYENNTSIKYGYHGYSTDKDAKQPNVYERYVHGGLLMSEL